MTSRALVLALSGALLFTTTSGCTGMIGGAGGAGPDGALGADGGGGGPAACAQGRDDEVRMRLAPTCVGCHGEGASRPFFASLTAFEQLLVDNPAYVVRGDPDASALVAMLEGRGTGTYRQMPISDDPFAARAMRGETRIGMDEIREWIRTLPPLDPSTALPDPAAPTARRLSAAEAVNAIEVALGQAPTGGEAPFLDVTGMPAPMSPDSPAHPDYRDGDRQQTWLMLGGPSYLSQRPPEPQWSPSSLTALTQIAQGACAQAVTTRNPQLLHMVSVTDRLPAAEPRVRANIAYLVQRFLHASAPDPIAQALFTRVYAPTESASGPAAAWTQVCTALIRDPLFITF